MPEETRACAAMGFGAHLGVDQIVGHEEIPIFGERADSLRPELDGLLTVGDEVLTRLVGPEAERLEPLGGGLLGGDVASDAAGALLPFFRRLDDDGGEIPSARTATSVSL